MLHAACVALLHSCNYDDTFRLLLSWYYSNHDWDRQFIISLQNALKLWLSWFCFLFVLRWVNSGRLWRAPLIFRVVIWSINGQNVKKCKISAGGRHISASSRWMLFHFFCTPFYSSFPLQMISPIPSPSWCQCLEKSSLRIPVSHCSFFTDDDESMNMTLWRILLLLLLWLPSTDTHQLFSSTFSVIDSMWFTNFFDKNDIELDNMVIWLFLGSDLGWSG